MHSEHGPGSDAARVHRCVLVVDVVESVRLIEEDEDGAIRRWQSMVGRIASDVLPRHGGRMVKSLGDGMMLEFHHARQGAAAALDIQRAFALSNEGLPPERRMLARVGAHSGSVIVGDDDIFGHDVNLAARVTRLAAPGEIVVTAALLAELDDAPPSDVRDLGDHELKHVSERIRVYRLGPAGPTPINTGLATRMQLQPIVAVIPFDARATAPDVRVLGEVLADDVIAALSATEALQVISRLSTTIFRDRAASLADIGRQLRANYVLSGWYRVAAKRVTLVAELADVDNGEVVWSRSLKAHVDAIVNGEDEIVDELVARVSAAIMQNELQRARSQPMPTLNNYTKLMAAIMQMHRGGDDFQAAGKQLKDLTDSVPHAATPHAWLAKWHVLRFNRGLSKDAATEARLALDCTKRALDADDTCALAFTMEGFAYTHLLKRLDRGQESYEHAIELNPNESLAWLLKGSLHAFRAEGEAALESSRQALSLSPLDPIRYYFESLAATAALSAHDYPRAVQLAKASLRANRIHSSTFRALAIAQAKLDRLDEAKQTVEELLRLEPDFTIAKYAQRHPSSAYETGRDWCEALRKAGAPD